MNRVMGRSERERGIPRVRDPADRPGGRRESAERAHSPRVRPWAATDRAKGQADGSDSMPNAAFTSLEFRYRMMMNGRIAIAKP
jgi:hypothetical protein